MATKSFLHKMASVLFVLTFFGSLALTGSVVAQDEEPTMLDPALGVQTFVDGLTTPTSIAFLDEDEMFVLEKSTGQVRHVVGGELQAHVPLDLAVNFSSERGLLGITLDPDFSENGHVYLYWTCSAPAPTGTPYFPSQIECADEPALGEDTDDILAVPLLGNRVDRFVWDGSNLTWDMNLVKLRVFQNDGAPIPRDQGDEEQLPLGNHDGGVITFGQDGKLYIIIGDVGRRGALQNLPFGPISYNVDDSDEETLPAEAEMTTEQLDQALAETGSIPRPRLLFSPFETDDQFGGPQPDDAHFTGVIIRLNPDGSIPTDNPFYDVGSAVGGEIGENLQMTFAYGIRNSFGMDVDPLTGNLWISENGEDAYDELNLVRPGFNSGWIQIMGPAEDVADYKEIETTSLHFEDFPNLQQFRWGPENIAETRGEALRRLFRMPGSHFSNPEFTWEFVVAPAAIGFAESEALGEAYHGDLFVGLSVPLPLGGPLFRFDLNPDRQRLDVDETEAENEDFNSLKGSEEFLIGMNFGIVTDIETGPNGNLYVVSLDKGAVYEIFQETESDSVHLTATLTGAAEVPGPGDPDGQGQSNVFINQETSTICFSIIASDITLPAIGAHIHEGRRNVAGPVVVPLVPPDESGFSSGCVEDVDPDLIQNILASPNRYYVNVHTTDFPDGAIRGQLFIQR